MGKSTIFSNYDDIVSYYPVADLSTGRVGAPLICCEVKLRDWVEGKVEKIWSTFRKEYKALRHCGQIISSWPFHRQVATPAMTSLTQEGRSWLVVPM